MSSLFGSARIAAAFAAPRKPTFVAYVTGGYPTKADTVPVLLAMQECGVGIIEVRLYNRVARGRATRQARVVRRAH